MSIFNYMYGLISDYYLIGYTLSFIIGLWCSLKFTGLGNYQETPIILSEHDDEFELAPILFSSLLWFVAIPVYVILLVKLYSK